VLPSLNFQQLDFVKPSSGFHPVTWERVNTPLMPMNDEYGVYTSRSFALEFLWELFAHFKSILHENASTSHVYSILVDESID